MKGEIVNCPSCGNSFIKKRKNHKFCKNACRQNNHRQKHNISPPAFIKESRSPSNIGDLKPVIRKPQIQIAKPQNPKFRNMDLERLTLQTQRDYWAKVHNDAVNGIFPLITVGGGGLGYLIASNGNKKTPISEKIFGGILGAIVGNVIDEGRRTAIIKEARRNYDALCNKIKHLKESSFMVESLQQQGYLSAPQKDGTMQIINSNDYKKANIPTLGIKDKWLYLFGDAAPGFYKLVTGKPGNGKSTYCVEFAEYFNLKHGKVLYLASEQRGLNKSLQSLLKRFNASFEISMKPSNNIKELSKALINYKMVVIDSVNHLGLSPDDIEELRVLNPSLSIVAVMQSTKDGSYKGSQEYLHNCDIRVDMQSMKAHQTKSRFSPPSEISLISDNLLY